MNSTKVAKNVGTGLLVGGVATGLLRGFDSLTISVSLLGAIILIVVIYKHRKSKASQAPS